MLLSKIDFLKKQQGILTFFLLYHQINFQQASNNSKAQNLGNVRMLLGHLYLNSITNISSYADVTLFKYQQSNIP